MTKQKPHPRCTRWATGPYMLRSTTERLMVMERNPNFARRTVILRLAKRRCRSRALDDAGKPSRSSTGHISLEKKAFPTGTSLRGYYDYSEFHRITSTNVQITVAGDIALTEDIQLRRSALQTSVRTSPCTMASKLDPCRGKLERARKLRPCHFHRADFEK